MGEGVELQVLRCCDQFSMLSLLIHLVNLEHIHVPGTMLAVVSKMMNKTEIAPVFMGSTV